MPLFYHKAVLFIYDFITFLEGFKGFSDHCTVGIRISQVVFFCKFCVWVFLCLNCLYSLKSLLCGISTQRSRVSSSTCWIDSGRMEVRTFRHLLCRCLSCPRLPQKLVVRIPKGIGLLQAGTVLHRPKEPVGSEILPSVFGISADIFLFDKCANKENRFTLAPVG